MRQKARFLAAGFVCLACVVPLRAQADATPAAREPRWYGGGILAIDAASFAVPALVVAATKGESALAPASLVMGYFAYLLGGPIIHGAHHNGAAGGIDFLLRLAVPVLTAVVGGELSHSATSRCEATGADFCDLDSLGYVFDGFVVGAVAVSFVDVAALAWTSPGAPSDAQAARPARAAAPALQLAPLFAVRREQGRDVTTLGVGGAF
jgi:hypothetical protein